LGFFGLGGNHLATLASAPFSISDCSVSVKCTVTWSQSYDREFQRQR
jgi:hypothetical protein